jgi:hypothetical protein
MAMFVLDLFDFFCLSSFRLSDSFDEIRRPTGGSSSLRSFVPAGLFARSKMALHLRSAKP